MKILSIDTSTECATCALVDDSQILGELSFNYKKQHSTILMPMIENLLKNVNHSIADVDGFVVSKGPGSFTGLRIGMAAIKGLSQGSQKPFISISSLDALANNFPYFDGYICAMMDALRDNVYCSIYKFEDGNLVNSSDYMAISINELLEFLNTKYTDSKVLFVGDGICKFKEIISSNFTSAYFAPNHLNYVRAAALGVLGLNLLKNGIEDNLYTSAPIYLKKSQAEREYEERLKNAK